MKVNRPTAEHVRATYDYDPKTGIVTHKRLGRVVGSPGTKGYLRVKVKGETYLLHIIIWLWVTGKWPTLQIDHRNRVSDDNRWDNLRELTLLQNRSNTLGKKGYTVTKFDRYVVRPRHLGKFHYIGTFKTKKAARAAYLKFKREVVETSFSRSTVNGQGQT